MSYRRFWTGRRHSLRLSSTKTLGTNISSVDVSRGDAEAAFRAAPYMRRETFRVHRHTAVPMETRGLVAEWDAANERMTVSGITKVPFFNRTMLAGMLELPESAVVMKVADTGGGFGVRGEFYPEDFLIPFIARKLKRAVKWVEDRREHFLTTNHSREATCHLEIACDHEGIILALRGEVIIDIGAYARGTGGTSPTRCAQFLPGPYRIPNFSCKVNAHVSNKTPCGTYRGPGRVEANFFRERLIDMAAADLGVDPADIRRRNFVTAQEMPFKIGKLVTYEPPAEFNSGTFRRRLRAGAEGNRLGRQAIDARARDRRLASRHRTGVVRGKQCRRTEGTCPRPPAARRRRSTCMWARPVRGRGTRRCLHKSAPMRSGCRSMRCASFVPRPTIWRMAAGPGTAARP